jgi:sporulation protein YlmC with PRC-barrel domain
MDAAALIDREIVSVNEATRLGKVREILFDTHPLRVSAIKASGDEGEFIISLERVSRLGPDAVMVESGNARELARAADQAERTLEELTHLKVVDEDGKALGTVRRIEFDEHTGEVQQVVAGGGGLLGMGGVTVTIRARAIRGVGTDLLTVASSGEVADDHGHDRDDQAESSDAIQLEAGNDRRSGAE